MPILRIPDGEERFLLSVYDLRQHQRLLINERSRSVTSHGRKIIHIDMDAFYAAEQWRFFDSYSTPQSRSSSSSIWLIPASISVAS